MDQEAPKRVPNSISFTSRILQIPALQEVGIPLAGLTFVKVAKSLTYRKPEECWIARGDLLLTYELRFFANESKPWLPFFDDPIRTEEFQILSPASGLLVFMREEESLNFTVGLQYQFCSESALPVLLVPEDEPLPDHTNFYRYHQIARLLLHNFDLIPIRRGVDTSPQRLGDWLRGEGSDRSTLTKFNEFRKALETPKSASDGSYQIRELTIEDRNIISQVQSLRGSDLLLREKLVHISRKFAQST